MKSDANFTFFRVFAKNPRATGAIVPSSKRLAREMASHVLLEKNGVVVELGPGTGVITNALINSGVLPEDIITIEYSGDLVEQLQFRFPALSIIKGNAANLADLLANEKRPVNTIISSLPLRLLPKSLTQKILKQIQMILSAGGRYIQYTYSFKQGDFYSLMNGKPIISKRVWLNFPPARVDVYVK